MKNSNKSSQNCFLGKEGAAVKERKKKVQSRVRYPVYGLDFVCEVILPAIQRAGDAVATLADVLRETGIGKFTDRQWAYGVPASMFFGLIERVGRGSAGKFRITELGLEIIKPRSEMNARLALLASARKQKLYEDLIDRFAGTRVPNKSLLVNILERDYGISASMTAFAAEAFLQTVRYANLVVDERIVDLSTPTNRAITADPEVQTIQIPDGFIVYHCKISKKRIASLLLPRDFTPIDAKKVQSFIESQVDEEAQRMWTPESAVSTSNY